MDRCNIFKDMDVDMDVYINPWASGPLGPGPSTQRRLRVALPCQFTTLAAEESVQATIPLIRALCIILQRGARYKAL